MKLIGTGLGALFRMASEGWRMPGRYVGGWRPTVSAKAWANRRAPVLFDPAVLAERRAEIVRLRLARWQRSVKRTPPDVLRRRPNHIAREMRGKR